MATDTDRPVLRPPLEGEDVSTNHWEDARHWLSVYSDLLRFKHRLLDRVRTELQNLSPDVQRAAAEDLGIIERQMEGYRARLDLWYQRAWDLQGLWLEPETRLVRHRDRQETLTEREFELLKFLVDHPHRSYTADQLMTRAWGAAGLYPEEVRNYVLRLRKMLARLEIPCDLVNRPGRGYSLVFRVDE